MKGKQVSKQVSNITRKLLRSQVNKVKKVNGNAGKLVNNVSP